MSRVGKMMIKLPSGVELKQSAQLVTVKGGKGELSYTLPGGLTLNREGELLKLARTQESDEAKAQHGLARSMVANMVTGVSQGFSKQVEIIGIGYKAEVKGDKIEFTLGFSHPILFPLPKGIKAEVDKAANVLKLSGCDKQVVGQLMAEIRSLKPPEPYKGTGIKYVGEVIRRKAGKAAAGAAGGGAGAK